MRNFLFTLVLLLCFPAIAYTVHEDESITLSAEEVEQTRNAFQKIAADYIMARDKLEETTKELNKLKLSKCL